MNKTILTALLVAATCMFTTRSNAQQEALQMGAMQVADLSMSTATISWTTDQLTTGNLVEITSPDSSWQVADSYAGETYAHFVQLSGLEPSTEYSFKIISAGVQFDNDGGGYKFSTLGVAKPGNTLALFGALEDSWGNPLDRCLVKYWLYNVEEGASQPRVVLSKPDGKWNGNIGMMYNNAGTSLFISNGEDLLFVEMTPNYWTSVLDSLDKPVAATVLGTRSIRVIDPNASEPGDVDDSGALNIFDVLEILKIIGGKITPDPRMGAAADVDASGKIDIFDLLALLKKLRPTALASS